MKRLLAERADAFGALGHAALDLLRAESSVLGRELRLNARRLAWIAALGLGAVFLSFWGLGVLVLSAVEAAALWLPRWGAALAVFALLILVASVLALIARWRFRRVEAPGEIVRRRAEHVQEWWDSRPLRTSSFDVEEGTGRDPDEGPKEPSA